MTADELEQAAARLPLSQLEHVAQRLTELAAARRWQRIASAAALLDRPALG